jgi:hypothetical protein
MGQCGFSETYRISFIFPLLHTGPVYHYRKFAGTPCFSPRAPWSYSAFRNNWIWGIVLRPWSTDHPVGLSVKGVAFPEKADLGGHLDLSGSSHSCRGPPIWPRRSSGLQGPSEYSPRGWKLVVFLPFGAEERTGATGPPPSLPSELQPSSFSIANSVASLSALLELVEGFSHEQ